MGNSNSNSQVLQQQQQQQGRVDTGMEQLNRIFGGGQVGVNPLTGGANVDLSKTYYDALGNPVTGSAAQSLQGSGQLFQGQQQETGFTPDFYKGYTNDILAKADPQVYQQYGATLGGLDTNLFNAGLGKSSASQNGQSSLLSELNKQLTGQADSAIGQTQQLQKDVGNEQSTLVNQLEQSANPAQTSVQALGAASQFGAPPILAPLGNLFSNWGSLYGANALQNQFSSLQNNNAQNFSLLNAPQQQFAGLGSNSIIG